jgi:hypothetical protein
MCTAYIHYMGVTGKYTQRRLTAESDVVNAVTALINATMKGFQLAGRDPDRAFRSGMQLVDLKLALLWQPSVDASRLQRVPTDENGTPWPSWSWAAWRGAVQYGEVACSLISRVGVFPLGLPSHWWYSGISSAMMVGLFAEMCDVLVSWRDLLRKPTRARRSCQKAILMRDRCSPRMCCSGLGR